MSCDVTERNSPALSQTSRGRTLRDWAVGPPEENKTYTWKKYARHILKKTKIGKKNPQAWALLLLLWLMFRFVGIKRIKCE